MATEVNAGTVMTTAWWEQLASNPWVISIVSGLITSIIVYIITKPLVLRRKNRELRQKATAANHEVLYSLRSGIPNGNIPEHSIILRIIDATARKYEITPCDMFSINELFSEIIKEVFDSAFITSDKKMELCNKFTQNAENISNDVCKVKTLERANNISIETKDFSRAIALIASLISGVAAYFFSNSENIKHSTDTQSVMTILPLLMIAFWFVFSIIDHNMSAKKTAKNKILRHKETADKKN